MTSRKLRRAMLATTIVGGFALPAAAQEASHGDAGTITAEKIEKFYKTPAYSPYAGRNFPARPFFGDTHLHTELSMDAGAAGARLGPREAYRFARGEELVSSTGQPVKLSRPLDFLVVADHSDNLGCQSRRKIGQFPGEILAGLGAPCRECPPCS